MNITSSTVISHSSFTGGSDPDSELDPVQNKCGDGNVSEISVHTFARPWLSSSFQRDKKFHVFQRWTVPLRNNFTGCDDQCPAPMAPSATHRDPLFDNEPCEPWGEGVVAWGEVGGGRGGGIGRCTAAACVCQIVRNIPHLYTPSPLLTFNPGYQLQGCHWGCWVLKRTKL